MEIRESILFTIGNSCKSKRYRNIKRQRDRESYTLGVKRKSGGVKNYKQVLFLYSYIESCKRKNLERKKLYNKLIFIYIS